MKVDARQAKSRRDQSGRGFTGLVLAVAVAGAGHGVPFIALPGLTGRLFLPVKTVERLFRA